MLFTAGCIKYSYNIEIDDKDNITISEIEAINKNFIKSFDSTAPKQMQKDIERQNQDFEKDGYTVEEYSDEAYSGLKITKKYKIEAYLPNNLPEGFSTTKSKPITLKKKDL